MRYSLDQIQSTKPLVELSFHLDFLPFLAFLLLLFLPLLDKLISSFDDSDLEIFSSETFWDSQSAWFNPASSLAYIILILITRLKKITYMRTISRFSSKIILFASTICVNPQLIISVLIAYQQQVKRCKVALTSESTLRAKIFRPFVNFQQFYSIHFANMPLHKLGLTVPLIK